jgi:serine/threonine-protein kinase
LFYVMPYVEGESLRDCLARERQLKIADALRITVQVAGALGHAHSHDFVHRDIKPENIMLYGGEAVVADFGIARAMSVAGSDKLTKTGMTVGTPAYMSPEQSSGQKKLDGRCDIYSLACVLYEMLAGHPPFTGASPQEIMGRHALDPVPRLVAARRDVSPQVENAVIKAMAKQPKDRFATAADFIEALTGEAVTLKPQSSDWIVRRAARAVGAWFAKGAY